VSLYFRIRRRERAAIWEWLEDAQRAVGGGSVPVVIFRRSRSGWWAALPLRQLLSLLQEGEVAM
jgi:hypothetical protein